MKKYSGLILLMAQSVFAADWPQWAGNRFGDWNEDGILEAFPEDGLKIQWRREIGSGFSAPVVANGRVFVLDYRPIPETKTLEAIERLSCLDEETGKTLWSHEWQTHYRRQLHSYATGPRAAPIADGPRIYTIGATGRIHCSDTETGKIIWEKDCVADYEATVPMFGVAVSPVIEGDVIIFATGGKAGGQIKAFDKATGKEVWQALSTEHEMPYHPLVVFDVGKQRQLIAWEQERISALDPKKGTVLWQHKYSTQQNSTIARPVMHGNHLFIASMFNGSLLLKLDPDEPKYEVVWDVGGKNEKPENTRALHTMITTPIIQDGYIYGTCSYGQFRCLDFKTGQRVWESDAVTRQGRWGSLMWVKNGDRYFINNDLGELIIARLSPKGFEEIDRTQLIEPVTNCGYGPRRWQAAMVNWVHPAYANRHVITRNDREILRVSLVAD